MIAALPMYAPPELEAAHDRLWQEIASGLRAEGIDAPEALTRWDGPLSALWRHPDLLLAQTCGLPFRAGLYRDVTLVGTPDPGLPGCAPGQYVSVILVRRGAGTGERPEALRPACNEALSQSGWAALCDWAGQAGRPLLEPLVTGSHERSAEAVARGDADLCAVDAVTWRLLQARRPELAASLKVLDRSAPTPALPLITARPDLLAPLRRACAEAYAGPAGQALGWRGLALIPAEDYLALPLPPPPAAPPG